MKQAYWLLDDIRIKYGLKSREYGEAWKQYRFVADMYKEGGE